MDKEVVDGILLTIEKWKLAVCDKNGAGEDSTKWNKSEGER